MTKLSRPLRLLLLMLPLTAVLVTGCWDRQPVDFLGLIIGVGVDLNEHNNELYDFTFGHPLFEENKRSAARIATISAKNIGQAQQLWELQQPVIFAPGKVRLLLFSQPAAALGMQSLLSYLELPKTDESALVAISKVRAEEVLRSQVLENERIATHISSMISTADRTNCTIAVRQSDLVSKYAAEGIDPVVPLIDQSSGKDVVFIPGVALLKDLSLVGELGHLETRLLIALLARKRSVALTLDLGVTGELYGVATQVRLVGPRVSYDVRQEGEQLTVDVRVKSSYLLRDYASIVDLSKIEETEKITEDVESNLTIAFKDLLARFQQLQVDPLGIGKKFRVKHHQEYNDTRFRELWSKAQVNVEVDLTYFRSGTLLETIFEKR